MKTRSPYLNYIADYMLTRQYSLRTINAYLGWIAKFILFHIKRHPSSMGDAEVKAFLDHIVLKRNMSPKHKAQLYMRWLFYINILSKMSFL